MSAVGDAAVLRSSTRASAEIWGRRVASATGNTARAKAATAAACPPPDQARGRPGPINSLMASRPPR